MKVSLITLGFCAFSLIFLKFSWIHCATNLDFSLLFEVYCTLALILAPLSPKDICKILKMAPYLWCEILTPTLLFVPSLLWHWIFFFFFTGSLLPKNKTQLSYLAYTAYTKFSQFNLLASFLITCAQIPDNRSTLESLLFPKHKHFAHVLIFFLLFCLESP